MPVVTVVCLAVCFLLASLPLYRRCDGQLLLSVDNIFIVAFEFLFVVLFPCVFLYARYSGTTRIYTANYIALYGIGEMTWYYIIAFAFLLALVIGYRLLGRHTGFADIMPSKEERKHPTRLSTAFTLAALGLFLVGIVADILYMWAYGGYIEYMKYSSDVRSGINNFVNPWSFMMPLRDCIPFASLLFLSQINRKNKHIFVPLFLVAFIHACMVYYSNRGRLPFALYFMVLAMFLFFRLFRFTTVTRRLLVGGGGISVAFLVLLVVLGNVLSRSNTTNIVTMLCEETAFFFANPKVLFDNVFSYRFFFDYLTYPLYLLPSSLWRRIVPDTASDMLTIFIDGSKKGENGVYGEAPVDMITLAYYQLNIAGVIVVALAWGMLFAFIYKRLGRLTHKPSALMLGMYLLLELALRSIFYCDSYGIVQRMLPFIGFTLLYVCIRRILRVAKKRSPDGWLAALDV